MNRYTSIPWPWAGLVLGLALLAQEVLLRWFGDTPSLSESVFRIGVMTLTVVSLVLVILPPRRLSYLLGFVVCAGLIAWALWLQYGKGLDPCPLCMLQRIAVCLAAVVFFVAMIHNPRSPGATGYALLMLLVAGAGAVVAGRQIWLQALPKDQVPSCGMGFSYMLDTLPFLDVIIKTLEGSGECADKGWIFLGLSIAGWSLVFFLSMIAAAFALIRRE